MYPIDFSPNSQKNLFQAKLASDIYTKRENAIIEIDLQTGKQKQERIEPPIPIRPQQSEPQQRQDRWYTRILSWIGDTFRLSE